MCAETFEVVLKQIASSTQRGFDLRREAMEALIQLDGYDWSGVYRLEGEELKLDAFVGDSTDHVSIPVGVGVCGSAVAENRNIVVEDVRTRANYLSCSIHTRSEIVVLIRGTGGEILGQIDIDGHRLGAFGNADETFLNNLGSILAERWV
jgi:L-methionine (R)-S-oxide reductase